MILLLLNMKEYLYIFRPGLLTKPMFISVHRYIINNAICITQYCAGDKIEKNEMGRACGAYGGGEGGV